MLNDNEHAQVNNTNFVYSDLGCDCESNIAGNTFYTHDTRRQLIDERTPSGTFYYLFDGLGSVVGLTDSTGALVGNETYHYDPYGQLVRQPHAAALQTNPWRFASGFFDVQTGLYKFGIRYYDPNVGRWTQRDPAGGSLAETTKMNTYVYGDDDPVNMVDPSGEFCIPHFGAFALGTFFGVLALAAIIAGALVDPAAIMFLAITYQAGFNILAGFSALMAIVAANVDIVDPQTVCF